MVWVMEFCNDCYWLLVTGDWQTRLLKKSGIFTFKVIRVK
jgi:hypothetical protein